MSVIKINNLNTFYQESGRGIFNILLLHGWGQSHAFWQDTIDRLSKNYHVYVLDLPGFGLSQEPPNIWNLEKYTSFVHEFVSKLHLSNLIIIGHSFGGRIASIYASQYSIKKLVLYSNGGLPQKNIHKKLYRFIFIKIGKYLFPNILYKSHTTIFKPKQYKNKIIINKKRSRRMLDIYSEPPPNLKQYLEKIKAKTLIIIGKKDYIVEPEMGKRLHELIRDSRLVEIPNATHFAHLEAPNIFYKELEEFIHED